LHREVIYPPRCHSSLDTDRIEGLKIVDLPIFLLERKFQYYIYKEFYTTQCLENIPRERKTSLENPTHFENKYLSGLEYTRNKWIQLIGLYISLADN